MGAQSTATVDFGAAPYQTEASLAVTGQAAILAGSLVEAFMMPATTADHSVDEHRVENIRFVVTDVIAATGFTIRAICERGTTWGRWNVGWVWN